MTAPKIEYADRIVRYPGQTYQIRRDAPGRLSVFDGAGGRTVGRAELVDGVWRWGGEDAATLERVIMDWVWLCLKNGKAP